MPRTSEGAHFLEDIDAAIEIAAGSYLLASEEVHIQDLLADARYRIPCFIQRLMWNKCK